MNRFDPGGREGVTKAERKHLTRLKVAIVFGFLFWLLLLARISIIQLGSGREYADRAKKSTLRRETLHAERGRILDRDRKELAINLSVPSFAIDPSDVDNPGRIVRRFTSVLGRPKGFAKRDLEEKSFLWLARKVSAETAEKIKSWNLKGIMERRETKRDYPFGSLAGQLLGYTDPDNRGIEGIEFGFDDILRGSPGWQIIQVDARGRKIHGIDFPSIAPQDGSDLVLTICAEYQMVLEEEIARVIENSSAESGIGIIMNPKTGEILAMANIPEFDPNRYSDYSPSIRRNRAVTDAYEPGSTFKIVASSAALELGTKSSEDSIFCENGSVNVAGCTIRDAHSYGWLTFREAIEHSSNIGIIKTALEISPDVLYRYIRDFGFGSETGIELLGESKGIVRHPSEWSGRSLATISMGQEISVTPLQLAVAYSAVANGGILTRPQIIKAVVGPDGRTARSFYKQVIRRVISKTTADTLTSFLVGVVENGTGVNARIDGIPIAGKTGTAEKPNPNGGGYLKGHFVSSFVGFLPSYDPELLCLIIVDSRGKFHFGSEVAAPVFKKVVSRILNLRGTLTGWSVAKDLDNKGCDRDSAYVKVPEVRRLARRTAIEILKRGGLKAKVRGEGDIVVAQSILPRKSVPTGTVVKVTCSDTMPDEAAQTFTVPSVIGMSLREAIGLLAIRGVEPRVDGSGVVRNQSLKPGSRVKKGAVCFLSAKPN